MKNGFAIRFFGDRFLEQVDVAVAKGVVDLGDNAGEAGIVAIAVKKADRVEDVIEIAGGGNQFNPFNLFVDAMIDQQPVEFLADGSLVRGQVVAVVQGDWAKAVVAEQSG